MLAKYWKKIGMIILIIACICNILSKLVGKMTLDKEMITSATYINKENKK